MVLCTPRREVDLCNRVTLDTAAAAVAELSTEITLGDKAQLQWVSSLPPIFIRTVPERCQIHNIQGEVYGSADWIIEYQDLHYRSRAYSLHPKLAGTLNFILIQAVQHSMNY